MIHRDIQAALVQMSTQYPVVTITGPRQSGKTTLCQATFADKPYVNFEALDTRTFAREDPRGFLATIPDGAVLDEIQRVPDLPSYLQEIVDNDPLPGKYILTGGILAIVLIFSSRSL